MIKHLLKLSLASIMFMCANVTHANIPMSYYSTLDGKSGAELKTAIYKLIKNANMLSYGSGNNNTWWGFYVTDYEMNNNKRQVVDRYSNDIRYFGSRGSSVSGMNIEHSFPKSWWGGTKNNAYKDLYNLMPCETSINSSKSNYGMGIVTNVTTTNGCTKVGSGANGTKFWEPADKWKGDFARGYMYMATAYQDFSWTGEGLNSLQQGSYPTLKPWAYELYLKWARNDKVNAMEIDRNEAVSQIQGNRNPYIDFPNLMEYVWGDSINVPFNLATTLKSTQIITGGDDDDDKFVSIYSQDFRNNNGGCTATGTFNVWKVDEKYGWKGSGFFNNTATTTDASIVTPVIDLTNYHSAKMEFSHAANKFNGANVDYFCSVEVIVNSSETEKIDIDNWPAGDSWTFISSGDIDLTRFAGKKIQIVFHYTSNNECAGTWEIKTIDVTASKNSSVETITSTEDDSDAPAEYYSIDGRRLSPDSLHGIVIVKQGHKVSKVLFQ